MTAFESEMSIFNAQREEQRARRELDGYRTEAIKAAASGHTSDYGMFTAMANRMETKMSDKAKLEAVVQKLLAMEPEHRTPGTTLTLCGYEAARGDAKAEAAVKTMALDAIAEATKRDPRRKLFMDHSAKPLPLPVEPNSAMALFESDSARKQELENPKDGRGTTWLY